jgi:hypothetical protein
MVRIISIVLLLVWTIQILPELLHHWAHNGAEHTEHTDKQSEGLQIDVPHIHCKKTEPFTGILRLHPAPETGTPLLYHITFLFFWKDAEINNYIGCLRGRAPPYKLFS